VQEEVRDDLFNRIRWHLYYDLIAQANYEQGKELIMNDKFLSDFSKAWTGIVTSEEAGRLGRAGVPDVVPYHLVQEAAALERQQKATSTSVTFDDGAAHVVFDDLSDRVEIQTGRGTAEIRREACAEIGRLLISLATPESDVTPGVSTNRPGDLIPKGIDPATWNGMTSSQQANYKHNQATLEYAFKMERQRQEAQTRQNQLDAAQRRNRW
jgi:hypothetical protein